MSWFNQLTANPEDYSIVLEAYDYYSKELEEARSEIALTGSLEQAASTLPGLVEYRFNQLQEVEAILELLNIHYNKLRSNKLKQFLENYNKALSSRDAEKYAEADIDVVTMAEIINQIAFIRNKYLGIMKGLDNKSFQINNITRLRCAGLEDAELNYGLGKNIK